MADQSAPLTPPPKRAALTVVVRWRALRWLDKPLSKLLGVEPRLLSSRVGIEPVRFEGTWQQHRKYWQWQVQTKLGSLTLSIAVFDLVLASSLLLAWLDLPLSRLTQDQGLIAANPGAAAAYSGLLFGFLLTVAVFAVQVRANRQDPSMLPLAPMISKKHRTFIVLSVTAGVALANLFFAFAGPVLGLPPALFAALSLVNWLLLASLTVMAIFYMSEVLEDAGAADLAMAMPAIEMAMREQQALDQHTKQLREAYDRQLADNHISYAPFIGMMPSASGKDFADLPIRLSGTIVDVDCFRLRRLASLSNKLVGLQKISVSRHMHDSVPTEKGFRLLWHSTRVQPQSKLVRRIGTVANSAFLSSHSDPHVPAGQVALFLLRLEAVLKQLAREGRHLELKDRLNEHRALHNVWLSLLKPNSSVPPHRFLRSFPWFVGPLDLSLHDLSTAATQSRDPEAVKVVAQYLLSLASDCKYEKQFLLQDNYLSIAVFSYRQCAHDPVLRDAIGKSLDSELKNLLIAFHPLGDHLDADERDTTTKSHDVALKFALGLIEAAIEFNAPQHAKWFAGRIFEDYEHAFNSPIDFDQGSVTDTHVSRTQYVALLLVAWSHNVTQHVSDDKTSAARQVMEGARIRLTSPERLIALWELYRPGSPMEAEIDHRLGTMRWDVRRWDDDGRSSVQSISGWHNDWIGTGLHVSLLLSRVKLHGKASLLFPKAAPRGTWKPERTREALEALANLVGSPPTGQERDERIDQCVELIGERAHVAEQEFLRHILNSPLSQSQIDKLKHSAVSTHPENPDFFGALRSCGLGTAEPRVMILQSMVLRAEPRETFINESNWPRDVGRIGSEKVAVRKAVDLVAALELSSMYWPCLTKLEELPSAIRDLRTQLSKKACCANVLVLPNGGRVRAALFGPAPSQTPEVGGFGGVCLGTWEDLLVLRCPYVNTGHAVLFDTRGLLTEVQSVGEPRLTAKVVDGRAHQDLQPAFAAAEEALESGRELPFTETIKVLARFVAAAPLALADLDAVVAIDLRQAGGYVLDEETNVYHRPGCELMGQGEQLRCLHLPQDKRLSACEICKPDEWDHEAEHRRMTGFQPGSSTEDEA